jgi:hypothetical protein
MPVSTSTPFKGLVGGHVVGADTVVDAGARTPDGSHHVIAGLDTAHVLADLEHAPEGLVAGDQDFVALGGCAVLGVINLLIGPVYTDAEHFYKYPATVWDVVEGWRRQIFEMDATCLSWIDGYCFHGISFRRRNVRLYTVASRGCSTLEKRAFSDSASVGWAKTASRSAV